MLSVSRMAQGLEGSQILSLAEAIRAKIRQGTHIYNLTIGDFDPKVFPIPQALMDEIIQAHLDGETQYPSSNGMPELREAIADYISQREQLAYSPEEFLVSSGARPLIFACYQALIDPGDKLIYPVPSWNNNFYSHIFQGDAIEVHTAAEEGFMPTAELLAPHIQDATLIALCSPLNPTGTVFSQEQLEGICQLVLAENERRAGRQKPLYVIYDQIYWQLCYGDTQHYNPVSLLPEMRAYTIFIDGISKAFAATGLRLGWSFGPPAIIKKMRQILSHAGAWSSRPVQVATGKFLQQSDSVDAYLANMRAALSTRLEACYDGFQALKAAGLPVDAISPQGALYLTVKLDLNGRVTPAGQVLSNGKEVYAYLLETAQVAMVPFYAFGLEESSVWHRLSVGTTKMEDIPEIFSRLKGALEKLQIPSSMTT